MPNLSVIFFTGLLTGGLTCMAVQGGLLATMMSQRQSAMGVGKKGAVSDLLLFLVAKLLAYTVLGLLLGWIGSFLVLSVTMQAVLMTVISVYMIGAALNMMQVHPIFRYFVFSPPKFLTRFVRSQSKNTDSFGPAILGALTIFIPCGTTQAMMALAIASGTPLWGGLILATFVVGTSPLFFLLGMSVTAIKDVLKDRFATVAAFSILIMAIWNLNGALILTGSPVTLQEIARNLQCTVSFCSETQLSAEPPVSEVTMQIRSNGYTVDRSVLKAGSKITLNLVNDDGVGCAQSFTIPKLGIQKVVPTGTHDTLTFTAPSEPGELSYTCSMGMYGGKFTIVKV